MEMYRETLEKVAQRELSTAIFWVIILFLILVAVWVSNYLYFKIRRNSQKQEKMRRQSLWALLALTVICIGLGVFVCVGTANTVLEIRKDIEDNTYITYEGSYSVGSGYHARGVQYDRWLTVDFDYDDYALLYMNSFFEWLATEEGYFEGRIVYGKNSLIVVEIDSE